VDTTYDYTKPELSLMLDLLRRSNGNFPIAPDELSWSAPTVVNPLDHDGRETQITATIVNSDRYRGNATYFYQRVPLRQLIPQCGMIPRVMIGKRPSLFENLTYLNSALGINLEQVSVEDANLNLESVNATTWTLVRIYAKATSRVYSESVRLYLKRDNNLV
jgi:hypothetical protein